MESNFNFFFWEIVQVYFRDVFYLLEVFFYLLAVVFQGFEVYIFIKCKVDGKVQVFLNIYYWWFQFYRKRIDLVYSIVYIYEYVISIEVFEYFYCDVVIVFV